MDRVRFAGVGGRIPVPIDRPPPTPNLDTPLYSVQRMSKVAQNHQNAAMRLRKARRRCATFTIEEEELQERSGGKMEVDVVSPSPYPDKIRRPQSASPILKRPAAIDVTPSPYHESNSSGHLSVSSSSNLFSPAGFGRHREGTAIPPNPLVVDSNHSPAKKVVPRPMSSPKKRSNSSLSLTITTKTSTGENGKPTTLAITTNSSPSTILSAISTSPPPPTPAAAVASAAAAVGSRAMNSVSAAVAAAARMQLGGEKPATSADPAQNNRPPLRGRSSSPPRAPGEKIYAMAAAAAKAKLNAIQTSTATTTGGGGGGEKEPVMLGNAKVSESSLNLASRPGEDDARRRLSTVLAANNVNNNNNAAKSGGSGVQITQAAIKKDGVTKDAAVKKVVTFSPEKTKQDSGADGARGGGKSDSVRSDSSPEREGSSDEAAKNSTAVASTSSAATATKASIMEYRRRLSIIATDPKQSLAAAEAAVSHIEKNTNKGQAFPQPQHLNRSVSPPPSKSTPSSSSNLFHRNQSSSSSVTATPGDFRPFMPPPTAAMRAFMGDSQVSLIHSESENDSFILHELSFSSSAADAKKGKNGEEGEMDRIRRMALGLKEDNNPRSHHEMVKATRDSFHSAASHIVFEEGAKELAERLKREMDESKKNHREEVGALQKRVFELESRLKKEERERWIAEQETVALRENGHVYEERIALLKNTIKEKEFKLLQFARFDTIYSHLVDIKILQQSPRSVLRSVMSLESAHEENQERLIAMESIKDQLEKQLEDGKRKWSTEMSRMHAETTSWEAKYNQAIADHHIEIRKFTSRLNHLEEKERVSAEAQLALAQLWLKWQSHDEYWKDNAKVNVGDAREICSALDELLTRMHGNTATRLIRDYGIVANRIWTRHFSGHANVKEIERFSPLYVFEATEKLCMGMEEELKKCTKMISSLEKKLSNTEERAGKFERETRSIKIRLQQRPSTAPPQRSKADTTGNGDDISSSPSRALSTSSPKNTTLLSMPPRPKSALATVRNLVTAVSAFQKNAKAHARKDYAYFFKENEDDYEAENENDKEEGEDEEEEDVLITNDDGNDTDGGKEKKEADKKKPEAAVSDTPKNATLSPSGKGWGRLRQALSKSNDDDDDDHHGKQKIEDVTHIPNEFGVKYKAREQLRSYRNNKPDPSYRVLADQVKEKEELYVYLRGELNRVVDVNSPPSAASRGASFVVRSKKDGEKRGGEKRKNEKEIMESALLMPDEEVEFANAEEKMQEMWMRKLPRVSKEHMKQYIQVLGLDPVGHSFKGEVVRSTDQMQPTIPLDFARTQIDTRGMNIRGKGAGRGGRPPSAKSLRDDCVLVNASSAANAGGLLETASQIFASRK